MTLPLFLGYLAATLAICLAPGPAVLLCSAQGMARGVRAGALAALGVEATNGLYWIVFVAGLGAVIAMSETVFTVIKYAGAAYLLILGALTIRNARRSAESPPATGALPIWKTPFVQGFANQLANPKAFLFLAVLVPQFVIPGRTTALDFAVMAATSLGIDFICLTGYAWIAARSGALFRKPAQIIWRERLAGVAQIAVGGMIAAMRRAA